MNNYSRRYTVTGARLVIYTFEVQAPNEESAEQKGLDRQLEPIFDIKAKPDIDHMEIQDYEEVWEVKRAKADACEYCDESAVTKILQTGELLCARHGRVRMKKRNNHK